MWKSNVKRDQLKKLREINSLVTSFCETVDLTEKNVDFSVKIVIVPCFSLGILFSLVELNFFREIKVQNDKYLSIDFTKKVFLENVALFQKQTDT